MTDPATNPTGAGAAGGTTISVADAAAPIAGQLPQAKSAAISDIVDELKNLDLGEFIDGIEATVADITGKNWAAVFTDTAGLVADIAGLFSPHTPANTEAGTPAQFKVFANVHPLNLKRLDTAVTAFKRARAEAYNLPAQSAITIHHNGNGAPVAAINPQMILVVMEMAEKVIDFIQTWKQNLPATSPPVAPAS